MLGGSFNPAHEGHLHISRHALRALHLNEVWWLVTPGNPFKKTFTPYEDRLAQACALTEDEPKIFVSDIENRIGSTRTFNTIEHLQAHAPDIQFVWIAGTDILHEIHTWYKADALLQRIPFAFFERPPLVQATQRANFILRNIPMQTGAKSVKKTLKAPEIFIFRGQSALNQSSTKLREQAAGATKA